MVNKKVNNGCGVKVSIPDVMPVIWVDDSKIDLTYLPPPTELVDSLPKQIRPYVDVAKVYLDIETTGLDPAVDRITTIGIRDRLGENQIFRACKEITSCILKRFLTRMKEIIPLWTNPTMG